MANPVQRGKGYGTAVQRLASDYLLGLPETNSAFAYTMEENVAERRALLKAGFVEEGAMPSEYYRVKPPPERCVLYVRGKEAGGK